MRKMQSFLIAQQMVCIRIVTTGP